MKLRRHAIACALLVAVTPARARLTAMTIAAAEPLAEGTAFGQAGACERVKGTFRGELDPADGRRYGSHASYIARYKGALRRASFRSLPSFGDSPIAQL